MWLPPGIKSTDGPDSHRAGPVPFDKTRAELLEECVWFTPALLYIYLGDLIVDPLFDFLEQTGDGAQVYGMSTTYPFFTGLIDQHGAPYWNHTVYGLSKQHADAFSTFFHAAMFLDRKNKNLTTTAVIPLTVPNWMAHELDRTSPADEETPVTSILTIQLFASDGYYGFDPFKFDQTTGKVSALPAFKFDAGHECIGKMRALCDKLLANDISEF